MADDPKSVSAHYEAVAESYHRQYDRDRLYDVSAGYPANYFRLQLLLNSFVEKGAKRIMEVGVGERARRSACFSRAGLEVWGFDISRKMVERSKERMKENGQDPERIFWGDIQDPTTYIHALKGGRFRRSDGHGGHAPRGERPPGPGEHDRPGPGRGAAFSSSSATSSFLCS